MPAILLPLYVYPHSKHSHQGDCWLPLKNAVKTFPNITFNLIINPFNGPYVFDECYLNGLIELQAYSNANFFIYVHALKKLGEPISARPIEDIKSDINKWTFNIALAASQGFTLHFKGIFIDEGSRLSQDIPFYTQIATFARRNGFNTVILNPGQIADPRYFDIADIVVQLENTYAAYHQLGGVKYLTGNIPIQFHPRSAVIVNTFDQDSAVQKDLVNDLVGAGFGMVFVTKEYASFHALFPALVKAVSALT